MFSTKHSRHHQDWVQRKTKVNGQFQRLLVCRPQVVADYNNHMGGVDQSDQMFRLYSVQSRTRKWWKTLFLHFFDIAVVNAYILWKQWKHEDKKLRMKDGYSILDFRTDLAIQLAELDYVDESFTVPLPLEGMILATVLKPLTEKAQAECLQKGEDALRNLEGPVHPMRGIESVFSGEKRQGHTCQYIHPTDSTAEFAGMLAKPLLEKEWRRRLEWYVLDVVVCPCVSNLVIPKAVVTVLQFFIDLRLISS